MSAEHNPPAFPRTASPGCVGQDGMSLRDALAMHAPVTVADACRVCGWDDMSEVPIGDADRAVWWGVMALMRYEYADAMLEHRKEKSGG